MAIEYIVDFSLKGLKKLHDRLDEENLLAGEIEGWLAEIKKRMRGKAIIAEDIKRHGLYVEYPRVKTWHVRTFELEYDDLVFAKAPKPEHTAMTTAYAALLSECEISGKEIATLESEIHDAALKINALELEVAKFRAALDVAFNQQNTHAEDKKNV